MRGPCGGMLKGKEFYGVALAMTVAACGLPPVEPKAAKDLSCAEAKIETEDLAFGFEKVSGCGNENLYAYDNAKKEWTSPLDRAAFDLDCERNQLTTRHLGARNVGVTGCGKKAVYVLVPRTGWVLNTGQ